MAPVYIFSDVFRAAFRLMQLRHSASSSSPLSSPPVMIMTTTVMAARSRASGKHTRDIESVEWQT